MQNITIKGLSKLIGGTPILTDLNLSIPAGKFFVLLGPSGCGKTTLLRLIAGLEKVDSGQIFLGDEEITHVPMYKRKINTVFQNYALFPHLSVFENVAYGLRVKGVAYDQIKEKVQKLLSTMRLKGHEQKNINNLSGGQRQRVSLARALINEPEVLLFDEPLAALDMKLKEQLLIELIDLQEKLNTTFVYITHDQTEALTVADSLAIMNSNGVIEQLGKAEEIYEFPATKFVANFVGTTNFFDGTLKKAAQALAVEVPIIGAIAVYVKNDARLEQNQAVSVSVRPEKIFISTKLHEGFSNRMSGSVEDIVYYGQSTKYHVRISSGQRIIVYDQNDQHFPEETIEYEDKVYLHFQKENVTLLGS